MVEMCFLFYPGFNYCLVVKKIVNAKKIYCVRWWDHVGSTAWQSESSVAKEQPALCETIGYLIAEDDLSLKLADTVILNDSEKTVGGVALILKDTIVKQDQIILD